MASQLITEDDQKELQTAFSNIDRNGDGTISREELIEAFTATMRAMGKQVDHMEQRIMKIIEMVDSN